MALPIGHSRLKPLLRRLPIDHIPNSGKVLRLPILILKTMQPISTHPETFVGEPIPDTALPFSKT